jgi:3-hydroxyisobutyrate dehydrogenase-like beta-hydroxyacid dehydrogenase
MTEASSDGVRDIGFLGLGTMGASMATRLIESGHRVHVWNRSPAVVDRLVALGAVPADSPVEALRNGIAFSMLANDAAVDEVFSPETLEAATGSLHVNMASISPALATTLDRRHAEAGVTYAAAPVLGRPAVAAAGKLNILFAGSPEARGRVEPYLSVMGIRTWDFGTEPRTANMVKIAVNYNIIHALQALAESAGSSIAAMGMPSSAAATPPRDSRWGWGSRTSALPKAWPRMAVRCCRRLPCCEASSKRRCAMSPFVTWIGRRWLK